LLLLSINHIKEYEYDQQFTGKERDTTKELMSLIKLDQTNFWRQQRKQWQLKWMPFYGIPPKTWRYLRILAPHPCVSFFLGLQLLAK
jgi:hypothetical protein